jgi:hypothetical protein
MSWQARQQAPRRFGASNVKVNRAFLLHHLRTSSSSSLSLRRQRLSTADLWAYITFTLTLVPGSWHSEGYHHHESTRRRIASGRGLPS